MNESKFKTLRHIETVRNYINACVITLIKLGEGHDQSKLQSPEAEDFDKYTPLLRGTTYGSEEYKAMMKAMQPTIDHHNANNTHHPEHHKNGILDMNLLDLTEMMCDWLSASKRHTDGNILRSLEINQKRFGYSDELKQIFKNTVDMLEKLNVSHFANES